MKKHLNILAISLLGMQVAFGQTAAADNTVSESITFTEPLKGPTIYGIFEGRSPCAVNRQFNGGLDNNCDHLKWQVVLFHDSITKQPTTYRLTTEMVLRRVR